MFFNKILNALKVENLYPNSGYSFENPSDSLKTTADSCDEFQKNVQEQPIKKISSKNVENKSEKNSFSKNAIHEPVEKKPLKQTTNKTLQKRLSPYELERYAVMCNAQLEHDDEMSKYIAPAH